MNETRCVAPSTDVRDSGGRRACCAICGKALKAAVAGIPQWWCSQCHRQYGLTTYAEAPEWVRFLKLDEEKRRRDFDRDEGLISWEALAEAEDADEEAGTERVTAAEEDPAIAEAEMRIDGELWLKKQKPDDVRLLEYLQAYHSHAEAGKMFNCSRQLIDARVLRLKASLRRFLEA